MCSRINNIIKVRKHLEEYKTDPFTGLAMKLDQATPDFLLQNQIRSFIRNSLLLNNINNNNNYNNNNNNNNINSNNNNYNKVRGRNDEFDVKILKKRKEREDEIENCTKEYDNNNKPEKLPKYYL